MVAILAHAMVSSLGCDSADACAAARAGLTRAALIDGMEVSAAADGNPEPVVVHAVPVLTKGFEGEARLQRMVDHALLEMKVLLSRSGTLRDRVGAYFAVPDPAREYQALDLITAEAERQEKSEIAGRLAMQPFDGSSAQRMLTRAADAAEWPGTIKLMRASAAGQAAALACMAAARQDLEEDRLDLAIVAAVDSLVSPATLIWLHQCHRLKTTDMPIGLMPGEGCVMLAMARGGEGVQGHVLDAALGQEPLSLWSGATSVGQGLGEVMSRVAQSAGWKDAEASAWVISDHNGEVYRANEWGHALVRLQGAWPAASDPTVWFPAISFGDTGSAAPLIGACMALRAFERGHAPADRAMVLASSEGEARAALVLAAP
ncbi:hypothetical protein [Variovorax rhizosphaerae]|uniref:Beta-ketoacyl synthase N-terminal domain-containing protein n=1 Tax=Variovorax rhizosphaerae TaxID=1836200 RepID=A0ABU8WP50_9BURK